MSFEEIVVCVETKSKTIVHQFDEFLLKTGVVRSRYDFYVYILKKDEKVILYLLLKNYCPSNTIKVIRKISYISQHTKVFSINKYISWVQL